VAEAPVRYGYKIVNAYPHDPEAYTQGLFWYGGNLWESTGEYGHSTLREVALETGEVIRQTTLSDDYFAEGAVELGGKVYLLTWLEGTCFVYNAATLAPESTFNYKGEGWGLATDGRKLYMSDGTPNITVRSPETFAPERTIVVRSAGRPVQYINELEWIDGRLWANVYLTNNILIIDPESGRVEGIIDFGGIASQLAITPSTDVMNGIAYDAESGRIFVTGKRWNRLFEVEITRK
jgi:glutamine cyclotransferase